MSSMGPDDAGRHAPSGGGVRPRFGELASDALRYWEPRRALSGSRATWARWRWSVLVVGTAFAAVLAHFFTLAIMG